nr:hypothetical protein HRS07_06920 [Escherichia coli]
MFDHGKRAVSAFPIATGTYYKVDYSAGVDISRYKMCPFQPHIWLKNHSTILLARGVTMKMVVCYTLPTTILRQVKTVELGTQ